jgi:hypothetical protein
MKYSLGTHTIVDHPTLGSQTAYVFYFADRYYDASGLGLQFEDDGDELNITRIGVPSHEWRVFHN